MNPNDIAEIRERMHSRKIKVTKAQKTSFSFKS